LRVERRKIEAAKNLDVEVSRRKANVAELSHNSGS